MRAVRMVSGFVLAALCWMFLAAGASAAGSAEATIPAAVRIQPGDLADMLHRATTAPVVLQVGSKVLYDEAHIAGAQYAGPAGQPEGIQNLKAHADGLPRDRLVVIYCGCCPWSRCPNIAPAYLSLRDMGFSNIKVLYLANNFGQDWVDKGYPVERGH
jgi:thiosulfate/3-mercaptopyruvate sulfurtransferase